MPHRRILLADDDPRDVELSLMALGDLDAAGCVDVVSDGVAVLDYLRETRGDPVPAVVILDLNMPGLDGLEVLRRMKSDPSLKRIPVVAFTSSREDRDLHASYEGGVNAYVVKPLGLQEYLATVRRMGEFWLRVNVPEPDGI